MSFVFLDSLFSEEYYGKVSKKFLNRMNQLGTRSTGGLVVDLFYKCFALFRPVLPHLGSELSVVCFVRFLIL